MAIIQAINTYILNIPINTSNVRGVIRMNCASGWAVTIQFRKTGALPNNQLNLATKSMLAFAPAESYEKAVDLLRYEKPTNIIINEVATPPTLNLVTGNEPLGEGEA